MTEQPQQTDQDNYDDQDAEPTMTAPDDARPDGKPAGEPGDGVS